MSISSKNQNKFAKSSSTVNNNSDVVKNLLKPKKKVFGISSFNPFKGVKNLFTPTLKRQATNVRPKKVDPDAKVKVFKPKTQDLFKQKIKNNFNLPFSKKINFSFGIPSFSSLGEKAKRVQFKDGLKFINFYLVKWNVSKRFNQIVGTLAIISVLIFIFYLSLFDRYFLVKNYTVTFSEGSFLNQVEMRKILSRFSDDKVAGFLPNNQFWFLNEVNLTNAAKKSIPEVEEIKVKQRFWPSGVYLEMKTEEILLTLGVTENNVQRFWRITQNGKVLTEDTAGLKENLVTVTYSTNVFPVESLDKARDINLQSYSFTNDRLQLNRFWFIRWLWTQLEDLDIKISKTVIPSLVDTDVIVYTQNGTKLLFDAGELSSLNEDFLASDSISKNSQTNRLQLVSNSSVMDREATGKLAYIDFRIPKRIFVCQKGRDCDK